MSNTYDLFAGPELEIAERMLQRRLQLLVHSCLYYEMDTNIISDRQWDIWARELLQLQKDYPDISKEVAWYDAFKDWDASTGAFLPLKDEWVVKKAKQLTSIGGRNNGKTYFMPEKKKPEVKQQNAKRKLF